MKLELADAEKELLLELLRIKKAKLPVEIHHCKVREFKEMLKEREKTVEGLLGRIEEK